MNIGAKIYAELKGDRVIWMILAVLSMFSILAVYSSTGTIAYKISGGNTTGYLLKHVFILGFGLFLAYLAYLTPYMRFMKMAPWLWLVAFGLLVFTLAFGVEINHAKRWIQIPLLGFTFQTSDFAKLALILMVAREISRHKDYIKDFNKAFLPIILPIIIICGLIAPADLSTALVLFATTFLMMFVGRVDVKFLMLLVFLFVVMFAFLIMIHSIAPEVVRVDTWTTRVKEFMSGEEVFQNDQAKIAIANGEWIGRGPGNSIQRNYLPTPYADFIYAIIIEEWGLIGGLVILSLYVLLFFRVTRLVTISEKSFGAMVAVGLSLNIVIQALANMAISVHLVPVGGLTLPMVSWGGTSMLFSCLFFGIILSVSRYIEQAAAQQAGTAAAVEPAQQGQQLPQQQQQQDRRQDGGGGQQQRRDDGGQRRDGGYQGGGGQRRDGGGGYQGGGQRRDGGGGGGYQGGGGQRRDGGGGYQGGGGGQRRDGGGGGGGYRGGGGQGGGGYKGGGGGGGYKGGGGQGGGGGQKRDGGGGGNR